MSSIMGTPASRWPQVTNRHAYEVVTTAYNLWPAGVDPVNYEAWLLEQPSAVQQRAQELHDKLRSSGLAHLLPGGLELLPDICQAYPWWKAQWVRLFLPRDFEGLTRHIVANLSWYLDLDNSSYKRQARRDAITFVVFMAMSVGTFLLARSLANVPHLMPLLAVLPLLAGAVSTLLSGKEYYEVDPRIEPAEFYLYISEAYSDPPVYHAQDAERA